MPDRIDVYHQWLGIPPSEQPPHAYRLLGVRLFERDLGVIRTAAERQMLHLRTYQLGEYSDLSQRLLNEVATARAQLLDPKRKAEYDLRLAGELETAAPTVPNPPPNPLDELLSESEPTAWLMTPKPAAVAPRPSRSRRRPRSWPTITAAAVAVLVLVVLAAWWLTPGGPPVSSAPLASQRPLDEVLREAADLAQNGQDGQAIALLHQYMDTAEDDDWRRGQIALGEMAKAVSVDRALEFWASYKGDRLADFQDTGRLPERCWLKKWGKPIETPPLRDVWLATLRRTLPTAVANWERKPKPIVFVTRELPVGNWPDPDQATAIEDVNAHPERYYGKFVYFDNAILDGDTAQEAGQGFLLGVVSAEGTRFPTRTGADRLVFATQADIFRQLKPRLADGARARVGLYCRIEKGKKMALRGLKTFPRAMIYKLEWYPSP